MSTKLFKFKLCKWSFKNMKYEGYFFKVRTVAKLEPQWESDSAQMCYAMSLVCPSIATQSTCQFWTSSERVNTTKTIESPAKCGVRAVIRFFIQNKWRGMLSPGVVLLHDNARPHTADATKRLLKRFRWEVFDHPPSSGLGSLIIISFLVWNGRRRTTFWSPLWDTRQPARLSRSGPGFDPRSGQVSWLRFLSGFFSPVRQMSGSFRSTRSLNII